MARQMVQVNKFFLSDKYPLIIDWIFLKVWLIKYVYGWPLQTIWVTPEQTIL